MQRADPGADFAAAWDSRCSAQSYADMLADRLETISSPDEQLQYKKHTIDVLLQAAIVGGVPSPIPVGYLDRAVLLEVLPVNTFLRKLLPLISFEDRLATPALLLLVNHHAGFITVAQGDAAALTLDVVTIMVRAVIAASHALMGADDNEPVVSEEAASEAAKTLAVLLGSSRVKSRALMLVARMSVPPQWADFVKSAADLDTLHMRLLETAPAGDLYGLRATVSQAAREVCVFCDDCWIQLPGLSSRSAADAPMLFEIRTETYRPEEILRANSVVVVLVVHDLVGQHLAEDSSAATDAEAAGKAGLTIAAWQRFTGMSPNEVLTLLWRTVAVPMVALNKNKRLSARQRITPAVKRARTAAAQPIGIANAAWHYATNIAVPLIIRELHTQWERAGARDMVGDALAHSIAALSASPECARTSVREWLLLLVMRGCMAHSLATPAALCSHLQPSMRERLLELYDNVGGGPAENGTVGGGLLGMRKIAKPGVAAKAAVGAKRAQRHVGGTRARSPSPTVGTTVRHAHSYHACTMQSRSHSSAKTKPFAWRGAMRMA
eukprot:SAG11_NODE_27_length_23309_cov_10.579362_22_plen_553_part_00